MPKAHNHHLPFSLFAALARKTQPCTSRAFQVLTKGLVGYLADHDISISYDQASPSDAVVSAVAGCLVDLVPEGLQSSWMV